MMEYEDTVAKGISVISKEIRAFLKDFNINWGISVISIGNRGIFAIFPIIYLLKKPLCTSSLSTYKDTSHFHAF